MIFLKMCTGFHHASSSIQFFLIVFTTTFVSLFKSIFVKHEKRPFSRDALKTNLFSIIRCKYMTLKKIYFLRNQFNCVATEYETFMFKKLRAVLMEHRSDTLITNE